MSERPRWQDLLDQLPPPTARDFEGPNDEFPPQRRQYDPRFELPAPLEPDPRINQLRPQTPQEEPFDPQQYERRPAPHQNPYDPEGLTWYRREEDGGREPINELNLTEDQRQQILNFQHESIDLEYDPTEIEERFTTEQRRTERVEFDLIRVNLTPPNTLQQIFEAFENLPGIDPYIATLNDNVLDFVVRGPEDEQDRIRFVQDLRFVLGFVAQFQQFAPTITVALMSNGTARSITRAFGRFVHEEDGHYYIEFVDDETVFWALYDDDDCVLMSSISLMALKVSLIEPKERKTRKSTSKGYRFPFVLKKEFDDFKDIMEMAQIKGEEDEIELKDCQHCFLWCLEKAVDENGLQMIRPERLVNIAYDMKKGRTTEAFFKMITTKYQFNLIIHLDSEKNQRNYIVNANYNTIDIDLIRIGSTSHFVPHVQIPRQIIEELYGNHSMYLASRTPYLMLRTIIQDLLNAKAFRYPTKYYPLHTYKAVKDVVGEDGMTVVEDLFALKTAVIHPFDMKPIQKPKKQDETKESKFKKPTIFFADFECYVGGEKHVPYCVCVSQQHANVIHSFYGNNCVDEFLYFLVTRQSKLVKVFFHNLAYDGRFLVRHIIQKVVMKGKSIYQLQMKIPAHDTIIVFQDSLAMIPARLALFPKMFNLETTGPKEIFPYNYYTPKTSTIGVIADCGAQEKPAWNQEQKEHFLENLQALGLICEDGIHFKAREYCEYYCKKDVEILMKGYTAFQKQVKDEFDMDSTEILTVSSLAYKYFRQTALHDDIYEYRGFIREWIRQAIVGGRCMCAENKKWKVEEEIVDFDACSLYPSAMHRLLLPTSIPQIIPENCLHYSVLSQMIMDEQQSEPYGSKIISCYIVRIIIHKVGIKRRFPTIYKRDKMLKTLTYTNESNIEMVVSNVYLEDMIRYHRIQFTILEGIWWKGKKSKLLSQKIGYVYNKRAELKRQKNPSENIYKLMMNSSYGKTIQKMYEADVRIINTKEQLDSTILTNVEKIKEVEQINEDHWIVKAYPDSDDLFIPDIVGCLILDMSKRIMNEVFDCCDRAQIPVYYQDTDSIHIPKKSLSLLQQTFQQTYGRELIGSQMGQFHSDFPPVKGKESWAIKSIFCGKKCYYDKLTNEDGVIQDQYRLKGIPQDVVEEMAKRRFGGSIEKLYEALYLGIGLEFDLLCTRERFEFRKDFSIVNKHEFKRFICFK